ncbi:LysR family transcriptional regulator [Roseibium polysiphoniae]|uniref:LysR family transcriptional regulator n=1 Tax=Roseibium polysiphoniae TaxID=2571221 RepID=A0ABR9C6M5_9HYPH|nr:LysR family transcriptional regulator [Roseibium polysiphoniae]MBD8875547.1 LysR family transcriptional regulator [Roseibium polysiphoniae]
MKLNRKNDLSLRLLEIFEALMRCQTTTGAAEDLGISQPAVSNGIISLEKQLGFALFERTGRKLRPTEDARLFLGEVEPLFSILRNIETEARDLRAAKSGRLRLSTTPPLGHGALPAVLSPFLQDRPNATVQYSVRRLETVMQNVQMGIADIGFVLGLKTHMELDIIPLAERNMVCVLPVGHPLAELDAISPKDLHGHTLIGLESQIGTTIHNAFEDSGVPFHAKVIVRYCHTACILASSGIGASVVDPYSALFASSLNIITRPFVPETKIVASAAVRRGSSLPRIAVDFIELVKRELSK